MYRPRGRGQQRIATPHYMKSRKATVLITFMLLATTVHGQAYEPLELAKRIFSRDSLLDIRQYATG
jgi:hypothetical protein